MLKSVSIQLQQDSHEPLYMQIANQIEKAILLESIITGERLPSVRKLMNELGVNIATLTHAYKILEQKELVRSVRGSGVFVTYKRVENSELSNATITENTINLASTAPHISTFPVSEFKDIIANILDGDDRAAFAYQDTCGYYGLRETLSTFLCNRYNVLTKAEEIIIVSGAQQGLNTIASALFKDGGNVILENPCYSGAKSVFSENNAVMYGVPMEGDGVNIERLLQMVKKYKPKLFYTTPIMQTPTTICYSTKKMKAVLKMAHEYNFYIVEDDLVSDIDFNSKRPRTLKSMDNHNKVIYIKSFSKILMPGVRIACICVPSEIMGQVANAKYSADISSPGLFQRGLNLFIKNGEMDEHLIKIVEFYRNKYNASLLILNRLRRYDITFEKPNGGFNFWIKLPNNMDSIELYIAVQKYDLLFAPGNLFYTTPTVEHKSHIRLCYSAIDTDKWEEGIGIIEKCINELYRERKTVYTPFI